MHPNDTTDKKITVRLLEAHFNGSSILFDYLNALDNPTANRVKKKFLKEVKKYEDECQSMDQSEAVYAFAAYLLKHPVDTNETDPEKLKKNIAIMAAKFCEANQLSSPSPGYQHRVRHPSDGASVKAVDVH